MDSPCNEKTDFANIGHIEEWLTKVMANDATSTEILKHMQQSGNQSLVQEANLDLKTLEAMHIDAILEARQELRLTDVVHGLSNPDVNALLKCNAERIAADPSHTHPQIKTDDLLNPNIK